jgi:hypothetical protein
MFAFSNSGSLGQNQLPNGADKRPENSRVDSSIDSDRLEPVLTLRAASLS